MASNALTLREIENLVESCDSGVETLARSAAEMGARRILGHLKRIARDCTDLRRPMRLIAS